LQAGLILWQQLLPKKAAAPREELLKLDLAGVSHQCKATVHLHYTIGLPASAQLDSCAAASLQL